MTDPIKSTGYSTRTHHVRRFYRVGRVLESVWPRRTCTPVLEFDDDGSPVIVTTMIVDR